MDFNTLEYFEKHGYVVIDDLIEKSLLERLLISSDTVTSKARAGEWDYVRVVGQMFPPWKKEKLDDIWGVQHLMHYKLNEKIFAEFYGSETLLNFIKKLMSCSEDDLQLELFNLLINPNKSKYEIAWHRDAIPLETPEQLEAELLKIPHFGCQWNTALYDDECLIVVPGSHDRPRTKEERKMIEENLNCTLPNQLIVKLKPGQTVFYNNNILHRAVYALDSEKKRRTLHACIGLTTGGAKRAANIFQHGLEWMKNQAEMKNALIPRLHPLYERLLKLAESEEKRKVELKEGDKLKWGIIGTGNIASKFIQALVEAKSERHQIVAIASSSDILKAIELKNKFPKIVNTCYCYKSYAELCADQNVDIVYIATPHSLHYRDALQALNFRKHVLVEKPFTLNKKEAELLKELAKANNLFLMEALWTRFMDVSTKVLDLIPKIEPIHLIEADLCINFRETDINSRMLNPKLGGGALLDLGIYPVSWVTYLIYKIGGNLEFPKIVSHVTKSKLTDVDETTSMILNYEKLRIQAIVNASMTYDNDSIVKLSGSNGYILILGGLFCPKSIELKVGDVKTVIELTVEGNGLVHEANHVDECLKKGLLESPIMSLEESILNMKILDEVRNQHKISYPGEIIN